MVRARASSKIRHAKQRAIREGLRDLGIVIPRKKKVPKYATEAERKAVANARSRERRTADPTYRERANRHNAAYARRRKASGNPIRSKRRAEAKRCHRAARRAREVGAPGCHSSQHLRNILAWQGGGCRYCGKRARKMHLDHIVPLARGGSSWPWNLQYLCREHNLGKGSTSDREYRVKIGLPAVETLDHPYNALLLSIIA